jgi:very-short-patch-repair endonuclease
MNWEALRREYDPPSIDREIPAQAKSGFAIGMYEFIADDVHGFWYPPDAEDGHCNPEKFAAQIAGRFSALDTLCCEDIGSPIEYQLGACLLWCRPDWLGFPSVDVFGGPAEWKRAGFETANELHIAPQASIAGYRVDFLLWFIQGGKPTGLAVECDGHDWHEKTKEQASRDKARDRAILAAGYPVVRFSGSDIFRDSLKCMSEVNDLLCGMLDPSEF